MRTASEQALTRVITQLFELESTTQPDFVALSEEFFALESLLKTNASVRASLEDAARSAADREALAARLFEARLSVHAWELTSALVREKWAEDGDLLRALDAVGAQALLAQAQREGAVSKVEEELSQAMRLLRKERDLRNTLRSSDYSVDARKELVRRVFGETQLITQKLLEHAVELTDEQPLASSLRRFIRATSELSEHLVAAVTSTVALTPEQEARLARILGQKYGTKVRIHNAIDASLLGGLRIHIGDDVIDGSLATRLAAVKQEILKQS